MRKSQDKRRPLSNDEMRIIDLMKRIADQAEEIAALREQVGRMPVWQSMDTAPKSGIRVILAWGDNSVVGYWLNNKAWQGWRTLSLELSPSGQPKAWQPMPVYIDPPAGEEQLEPGVVRTNRHTSTPGYDSFSPEDIPVL